LFHIKLNTPKLNLNQRKTNKKQTFNRLAQSDIIAGLRLVDILGVLQAIKGFDKSDFFEIINFTTNGRAEIGNGYNNGISEK